MDEVTEEERNGHRTKRDLEKRGNRWTLLIIRTKLFFLYVFDKIHFLVFILGIDNNMQKIVGDFYFFLQ